MLSKRRVSHPGIYIKEAIEELGLNQSEFALRSGLSIKNVSTLISGTSRITVDVARKLSAFFGNSVTVWINLQTMYDVYQCEKARQEELDEEWKIVKKFDKGFVEDLLRIAINSKNKEKTVTDLRSRFQVGTLLALKENDLYAFCKTSTKKDLTETNIILRNAWISLAEQVAKNKKCAEFNKEVILANLLNLRKLTLEQPEDFQSKLDNIFTKAGIKLVILPYLSNSLVNGVTKWIANENCVMIAINDCGRDADKMWFSLFHELGHAMKNHKRHVTISYSKDNIEDEEEIEANNFAKDALINKSDYEYFVSKKNFSLLAIKKFANSQNVADFIVIGRLQKDGYIGWNMYTNLKPKYSILCYLQ